MACQSRNGGCQGPQKTLGSRTAGTGGWESIRGYPGHREVASRPDVRHSLPPLPTRSILPQPSEPHSWVPSLVSDFSAISASTKSPTVPSTGTNHLCQQDVTRGFLSSLPHCVLRIPWGLRAHILESKLIPVTGFSLKSCVKLCKSLNLSPCFLLWKWNNNNS